MVGAAATRTAMTKVFVTGLKVQAEIGVYRHEIGRVQPLVQRAVVAHAGQRVALGVPPRPGTYWPAGYMDGYWPRGGHGTGQPAPPGALRA